MSVTLLKFYCGRVWHKEQCVDSSLAEVVVVVYEPLPLFVDGARPSIWADDRGEVRSSDIAAPVTCCVESCEAPTQVTA